MDQQDGQEWPYVQDEEEDHDERVAQVAKYGRSLRLTLQLGDVFVNLVQALLKVVQIVVTVVCFQRFHALHDAASIEAGHLELLFQVHSKLEDRSN